MGLVEGSHFQEEKESAMDTEAFLPDYEESMSELANTAVYPTKCGLSTHVQCLKQTLSKWCLRLACFC